MDFGDSVLRMLSALAVVLALMMVVVAIARRVMGARSGAHADAPLVRVLSTGYLGPKKSISVVSVAGELLIIGATATDLIPLGRVRHAERVDQLVPHGASSALNRTVEAGIWMP
ncbi:MAG TPA: flagellar biosynthetic protein FliO [Nitrospiraceae bacterium]|nr:flagellar biosynthetic protein FliO [Nitrospiraceae bacterium]